MSDLVGVWQIALSDGIHKVEFEHGTTSGKRIIRVDGKELLRREWMFKLVGRESFQLGKANCCINIEAVSGFAYEYSLELNGKSLEKFSENQSKIMCTWELMVGGVQTRVVLEKDTLDVWVNGSTVIVAREFVDNGTEMHFEVGNNPAYIKAVSSGKRRTGLIHSLYVSDHEIPMAKD